MNVLFAPDWHAEAPYQRLLAEALGDLGVRVSFLRGYKRLLPLTRLLRQPEVAARCDILHLHWPEAYYPRMHDRWDWFRRARFAADLTLATRRVPLVVTAHNLHAHNRADEPFAARNMRAALQRARAVIAHSEQAKTKLTGMFGIPPARIHVVPHGDLSVTMKAPLPQAQARVQLGLPSGRLCLMFGALEPYKGIEEVIAFWKHARPDAMLALAGKPISAEYGAALSAAAQDAPGILLQPGWLDDEALRAWLSAADCVLFNYRQILTSGAACLARSFGVPIVLPSRLDTVALGEPDRRVIRFTSFDGDLAARLKDAFAVEPDFVAADEWRRSTAWPHVAERTAAIYAAVHHAKV